jgi:hypothetical protein
VDDEIKEKLGAENLDLKVKASAFWHGGEGEESFFILGFEENIMIKYPLSGINVGIINTKLIIERSINCWSRFAAISNDRASKIESCCFRWHR